MKKYLTKITGKQIYIGYGYDVINVPSKWNKIQFEEINFEMVFGYEEYTLDCFYQLPNGFLVIRTLIGDEQPSSTLHILKDWKSELIEEEIAIKDFNSLGMEFSSKYNFEAPIPTSIKKLLNLS